MTREDIIALDLGIFPVDNKAIITIQSALEWVLDNTTLEFDIDDIEQIKALSARVKLFCIKFFELQNISSGVSSESISGLSQSFKSDEIDALIWQYAKELLYPYLKSRVHFVSAKKKWCTI